jgi:hypothetical protein
MTLDFKKIKIKIKNAKKKKKTTHGVAVSQSTLDQRVREVTPKKCYHIKKRKKSKSH